MTGGAPRPFDGIRILDLTHVLAGPFCTYQLAVLGAETIKIEEPGQGDIARQTGCDQALNRRLMGTGYLTQGANKRCLTLDLKDPRGREILKRLVVGADVLVENFRSGAMAALGLGYEDLRAINPRLIYCSMTGFGQDGPKAEDNAYDCVIQAISGLMSTTGWPAMPPLKTGAPVIDYASGLSAAFAISCALFQRERTGRGQRVDCAMLDTALMLMSSHLTAYLWSGVRAEAPRERPRVRRRERLRDQGRRPHAGLVPGRPAPAPLEGARPAGPGRALAGRRTRKSIGRSWPTALREVMLTRTAAEWEAFLAGDPRARRPRPEPRRGARARAARAAATCCTASREVPEVDRPVTVPVAGFRFADGGPRVDTPPRALGADTDAVLGELGLTAAEIGSLREAHVV